MSDEASNTVPSHVPRHAAPEAEVTVAAEVRRFTTGFTSLRDVLSFIAGVVLIGHEVFFSKTIEVSVLTMGVALAGLPVVFGADEKKRK